MNTSEIIKVAEKELAALTRLEPTGVKKIFRDEEGWHATVEVVEKKSIPDSMDVLALYDVTLDDEGNVIKFERGKLRKRIDSADE